MKGKIDHALTLGHVTYSAPTNLLITEANVQACQFDALDKL